MNLKQNKIIISNEFAMKLLLNHSGDATDTCKIKKDLNKVFNEKDKD